jgi:2-polyprenyl-6-methoxyphenol hydroxylase-like FAD-dependent oxidoreductase
MALPPYGSLSAEVGAAVPAPDAEVLIVGAGPVGCWLAAELCGAGVRVLVVEARESRASWSRGFVVHPRTLEIFDSRGVVAQMVATGPRVPSWHFAMGTGHLDFTVLDTAFPYSLVQPQARTEELVEEQLNRYGAAVLRGRRVTGLDQHPDRVAVRMEQDGAEHTLTAGFVVGCDGAHSTVRQAAGIEFTGNPDSIVSPSALVEFTDPPPPDQYMQVRDNGLFFAVPLPDGRFLISTIDHANMVDVEVVWTAEMMRTSLLRITGTDYGMQEPERVSSLGNSAKQAHRYRDHRVLLAGDAAHVHFPMGGQGMNLGIQDAHNLAWRLAGAVRAQRADPASPAVDALLDGYEAERRPVGERVLEDVRAQMALVAATGADGIALRSRIGALLSEHPQVNLQYAYRLSGLGVRYPVPVGDDPRLGFRAPDLVLDSPQWPSAPQSGETDGENPSRATRLYEVMQMIGPGRFVYLDLRGITVQSGRESDPTDGLAFDNAAAEVVTVTAGSVLGPDWALGQGWGQAEAILIRPDGHVVSIGTEDGAALAALAFCHGLGAEN